MVLFPLKFESGAKNKFFFFFNLYLTGVTDDVLLIFAVKLGAKPYTIWSTYIIDYRYIQGNHLCFQQSLMF